MDIIVNRPFTVKIPRYKIKYRAICLDNNNDTSFDKNVIKMLTNGASHRAGAVFTVEDQWFDEELTGRKIKYDELTKK